MYSDKAGTSKDGLATESNGTFPSRLGWLKEKSSNIHR